MDVPGAPVTIEHITPGSPLAIEYTGNGEQLVASRIVVQRPATVTTEPVTTGPVASLAGHDHVHHTALTHDEKKALKEKRKSVSTQ